MSATPVYGRLNGLRFAREAAMTSRRSSVGHEALDGYDAIPAERSLGMQTLDAGVAMLGVQDARDIAPRMERGLDTAPSPVASLGTVRNLFGRFTTPEVVDMVLADPRGFWKKGERRTLTTLFADVRGFTPFVARVPPEEAAATMNVIFGCLYDAIGSEHGIVNRFMGDGMLALFGAPLPLENHAWAAATAALKARATIELLAEARHAQGLEPLRIGLSINTGQLVACCVGTPERTEYTVVGHAVNLASRLVAEAHAGEILIGAETAKVLRAHFEIRDRGLRELKGIGPTAVFELVGPSILRKYDGTLTAARPVIENDDGSTVTAGS